MVPHCACLEQSFWNVFSLLGDFKINHKVSLAPAQFHLYFQDCVLANSFFRASPAFHALPTPNSIPLMDIIQCHQRGS